MTLEDLITILEEMEATHGGQTEVRLAFQPAYPFEYAIGDVVAVEVETQTVVYIGEGQQLTYLPGEASQALGWS